MNVLVNVIEVYLSNIKWEDFMIIKSKVTRKFTLKKFSKLKNIIRINKEYNDYGTMYVRRYL